MGIQRLAIALVGESSEDTSIPPGGSAYFYLTRGINVCDLGSYGFASSGAERTTRFRP